MISNNFKWNNKTILIAEDEESNFRYLEMVLNKTKASIVWAKDGIEAVSLCQKVNPDLILMDIVMPKVDGYQATKMIRQCDDQIPIIAMTAKALKEDKEDCLQAGMSDYLTKPVSLDELKEILKKYL